MAEITARHYRQNLFFNSIHEFSWGFGIAFHSTYAIVPLFLKQLGAPHGVVVSVAGLFSILIAIPQLFTAGIGRNIKNIRIAVIGVHMLVWPPVFMMGFVFAFLAPSGAFAWIYYYLCFILYGLAIGIVIPIWANFLLHVTNREKRGSFLGLSFAFNSVGGFIGGLLVRKLLSSSIPFPNNFGWGFLITFVSLALGTMVYLGFHVNKPDTPQPYKSISQFFKDTREILRTHLNFRRYLYARIFLTANFPAVSLYAVYTQSKLGFDISEAGTFTVLNVVSFGIASYLAGKIGDRAGHKIVIIFAFAANLMSIITALIANTMVGVYCIFIFLGLAMGSFLPSSMNLVYDFAGTRDSKTYMALIDTTLAPFTFLAITIVGGLTHKVSTEWIFFGIGSFLIIGILMLILNVKDPQHQPHDVPLTTNI